MLSMFSKWVVFSQRARGGFTPTPLIAQHLRSSLVDGSFVGIASVGLHADSAWRVLIGVLLCAVV